MVICDIDGTIADVTDRAMRVFGTISGVYGDHPEEMWEQYFDRGEMIKDPLIPYAKECLDHLYETHLIVILTGRKDTRKLITQEWLQLNGIKYHRLFMREEFYYDASAGLFKGDVAGNIIKAFDDGDRTIAFDDDEEVLKIFKDMGIEPMQAPGCWEPLYRRIKEG
jgi:hypothetical protein